MSFDRNGFNKQVGIRLRRIRQKKERTQAELAAVLGVTRATYANMESGRQGMTLDVAWRLATFFRVPLDRITPEAEDRRSSNRPVVDMSGTIVESLHTKQDPSHESTGAATGFDLSD